MTRKAPRTEMRWSQPVSHASGMPQVGPVVMREQQRVDAPDRYLELVRRMVAPRPASINSFWSPASMSVLGRTAPGSGSARRSRAK